MKRGVSLLILFVAVAASAGERSYRSGILKQIEIKDVTSAIPVSTGAGQTASIPIPLGLNFEFQVQSDIYVAGCWSKGKRSYGSEWVVSDPVEFRVEKDNPQTLTCPSCSKEMPVLATICNDATGNDPWKREDSSTFAGNGGVLMVFQLCRDCAIVSAYQSCD